MDDRIIFIGRFLDQRLAYPIGSEVLLKDVYESYLEYCKIRNNKPVKKELFARNVISYLRSYGKNVEIIYLDRDLSNVRFRNLRVKAFYLEDYLDTKIQKLEKKADIEGLTEKEQLILHYYKEERRNMSENPLIGDLET